MALDEPKEGDLRFETDGLVWLMTAEDQAALMDGAQGLRVDYVDDWSGSGFVVKRTGAEANDACGSGCSC